MRILIADDHPLFRDALRHTIDGSFLVADVVEARSYAEALEATRIHGPFDLVFLDLLMPGAADPFGQLAGLRAAIPDTPILVVSSCNDRASVERVLVLGAAAFISKSSSKHEIEAAIRRVLAGGCYAPVDRYPEPGRNEALSPRQTAVLELLARGWSNRQIASDLGVEEITVKAHISAILRKLHVKSRLEAVVVSQSIRSHTSRSTDVSSVSELRRSGV